MAIDRKIRKERSPRYPRIPLLKTMQYVERLYEGAHRSLVDSDTAIRVMGFANPSGASAVALGAVRQFGLVDGLRGPVRISDLAMRILEPSSQLERRDALKDAAQKPEIFSKILDQFGGQLPNSDEPVRSFLIREMQFSKSGADDCISTLRDTMREIEGPEGFETGDVESLQEKPASEATIDLTRSQPQSSRELIRIPLSKDCVVELVFHGQVTGAAIDRFVQHIQLMKDVWIED
jgi:hypothetical protein